MAPHDSLRKAAILITALDAQSADQLLDQMPATHAAKVREAIFQLDHIDPEEQRSILAEFLRTTGRSHATSPRQPTPTSARRTLPGDDVELVLSGNEADPRNESRPAAAPMSAHAYQRHPAIQPTAREVPPFDFLREYPGEDLARMLGREHPQTIAIVVAHLPAERSAELLEAVPAPLQVEILRRVADLSEADPEAIRAIEQELRKSYAAHEMRASGIEKVHSILAAAGAARSAASQALVEQALIETESVKQEVLLTRSPAGGANPMTAEHEFADEDSWVSPWHLEPTSAGSPRDLAQEIEAHRRLARTVADASAEASLERESSARAESEAEEANSRRAGAVRWTFADLADLTDRDLARVLQQADTELAMVALAGAEPAFVSRLVGQLPPALARQFSHRIETLGPLQLRDIEAAQRKIAEIAESLADERRIAQRPPRPFAMAA